MQQKKTNQRFWKQIRVISKALRKDIDRQLQTMFWVNVYVGKCNFRRYLQISVFKVSANSHATPTGVSANLTNET